MNSKTWWDVFDEDPYERVARLVPDCFGNPITAYLGRISWAYIDWLDDTYSGGKDKFFRGNHEIYHPSDGDLNAWFEGAITKTWLERSRDGKPQPDWCPPAPAILYMDID